ncbi:GNAT family N-acetyltransferase [Pleurocapsales cyanobacterium LEGE 06147]|nr:GNAT family N-acetyltransferase [Pleurocapsales cyanobacterium LEGE 06147]
MLLRPYQVSDAEILAAIYRDAVTGIGASAYDAQQIAVWSLYPEDIEEFRQLLGCGLTLVAVENSRAVAFGQLNPPDRLAYLYTASNFARLGYGTAIYQRLEAYAREQGIKRLHTEASRISKHLFLKMGFCIVERELAVRHGVEFERFKMEKVIG